MYVVTLFVLLLLAILASMLFAEDTTREVAVLTPIFAVACAQLFASLRDEGHSGWALGLAVLAVAQMSVALPNWIFGEDVWGVVRWFKVPLLLAGSLYAVAFGWLLRESLVVGARERMRLLVSFARARLLVSSP